MSARHPCSEIAGRASILGVGCRLGDAVMIKEEIELRDAKSVNSPSEQVSRPGSRVLAIICRISIVRACDWPGLALF